MIDRHAYFWSRKPEPLKCLGFTYMSTKAARTREEWLQVSHDRGFDSRLGDWVKYRPLALHLAHKYWLGSGRWFELDEMRGEALLGLVKAAKSFDETRGIVFSVFARRVISFHLLSWLKVFNRRRELAPMTSLDAPFETYNSGPFGPARRMRAKDVPDLRPNPEQLLAAAK